MHIFLVVFGLGYSISVCKELKRIALKRGHVTYWNVIETLFLAFMWPLIVSVWCFDECDGFLHNDVWRKK